MRKRTHQRFWVGPLAWHRLVARVSRRAGTLPSPLPPLEINLYRLLSPTTPLCLLKVSAVGHLILFF